jgi:putative ABC transport system permease protein
MHIRDNLANSLQSIATHKLRSILTLLGIMIGVAAVVTMFSSIYGIKKMITENMESMGWNNSIIVMPKDSSGGNPFARHGFRRFMYINRKARPLTVADYDALRQLQGIKYQYGKIDRWSTIQVGEHTNYLRLSATNLDFFRSKTYGLSRGRFFNAFEEKNAAKVCVVGPLFVERYYGNKNILNQYITVGANRYQVIGILQRDLLNNGNGMQFNPQDREWDLRGAYIPLSTGAKYLVASHAIDFVYIQSLDAGLYPILKNKVRQTLLTNHQMSHDFEFQDIGSLMLQISKEIDEKMTTWNITLSAIASISLLVGGIGLFSTLLISINEKMTEIGIRKSVGATEGDIFFYFLTESVTLSLIGAAVGVVVSLGLIKIVTAQLKFDFPFPIEGVLLGMGFSFVIGILSGFYPAWKASRINPIQAIFYFE